MTPKINESLIKEKYHNLHIDEFGGEALNRLGTVVTLTDITKHELFPELFPELFKSYNTDVNNKGAIKNLEIKNLSHLFNIFRNILNNSSVPGAEEYDGNLDSLDIIEMMAKTLFPDDIEKLSKGDSDSNRNVNVTEAIMSTLPTPSPVSDRYVCDKGTVKVLVGKWDLDKGSEPRTNKIEGNVKSLVTTTALNKNDWMQDIYMLTSIPYIQDRNYDSRTMHKTDFHSGEQSKTCKLPLKDLQLKYDLQLINNANRHDYSGNTTWMNYFNHSGVEPIMNILRFLEAFGLINDSIDVSKLDHSTKMNDKIFVDEISTKKFGLNSRIDNIIEALYTIFPTAKNDQLNETYLANQVVHPFREIFISGTTPTQAMKPLNDYSSKKDILADLKIGTTTESMKESLTEFIMYDTVSPTKSKAHLDLVKVFETMSPIAQEGEKEKISTKEPFFNKSCNCMPVTPSLTYDNFTQCSKDLPFQQSNHSTLFQFTSTPIIKPEMSNPTISTLFPNPISSQNVKIFCSSPSTPKYLTTILYDTPSISTDSPQVVKFHEITTPSQATPPLDPNDEINSKIYSVIPDMITKLLNAFTSSTPCMNLNVSPETHVKSEVLKFVSNHSSFDNFSDTSLHKTNKSNVISSYGLSLKSILEGGASRSNQTSTEKLYNDNSILTSKSQDVVTFDSNTSLSNNLSTIDSEIRIDLIPQHLEPTDLSQDIYPEEISKTYTKLEDYEHGSMDNTECNSDQQETTSASPCKPKTVSECLTIPTIQCKTRFQCENDVTPPCQEFETTSKSMPITSTDKICTLRTTTCTTSTTTTCITTTTTPISTATNCTTTDPCPSSLQTTALTSQLTTAVKPKLTGCKSKIPSKKKKTRKLLPSIENKLSKVLCQPTTIYTNNGVTPFSLMDGEIITSKNSEDITRFPPFSYHFEYKEKPHNKILPTEEIDIKILSYSTSTNTENFASTSLSDYSSKEPYSDDTTGKSHVAFKTR